MQHRNPRRTMSVTPWVFLVPLFLIGALIALTFSLRTSQSSTSRAAASMAPSTALPTYFSYSPEEMQTLSVYPSSLRMSEQEVYALQRQVMGVVKRQSLAPTTAAELYAAVAVAELDSAALSARAHQAYWGSLIPTVAQTVCLYVPAECRTMRALEPEDTYSQVLATLVVDKLQDRQKRDLAQRHAYPKLVGEQYWFGSSPTTPDAGSWLPWNVSTIAAFRAPKPPVYGSGEDLAQIAQVKEAVQSLTPEQKDRVLFWAGGMGTETPAGIWLKITDSYMQSEAVPLSTVLVTHALLTTTMEDAFISCWDNKFTYWVKRPFMRDSSLVTVIKTPNFPSYISGHSTVSAAAATVLGALYPEKAAGWLEMATEAKNTRLWAGIHFPMDNDQGFIVGQTIAKASIDNARHLRPWLTH